MDRRNILLGLTGAVAAPLLIRSTVAYGQSATDTLDPNSYATDTLQVGTLANLTSQVALQISTNPAVRRFAKLEIDEQTAVAQALTSNLNPPPVALTDDQQQTLQSLQALTGSAFDTAYIKGQIQGHRQLAAIQNEVLPADADPTADFVHVALIARAFIETHLTLLHALVPLAAAS